MSHEAQVQERRKNPLPLPSPQRREGGGAAQRLVARLHTAFDGIPYFDEELQVAQSDPHSIMVTESAAVCRVIAHDAELRLLSDHPIWYIDPHTLKQKAYYGDLVFARPVDPKRITARDLLLVIEVVSTNDSRRERKDTHFAPLLNEYNGVPELALMFPELDDPRALSWRRLIGGRYQEHIVVPGGRMRSQTVPELELEVLPRKQWTDGYKIDIYYSGVLRPRLAVLHQRLAAETTLRTEAEAHANRTEAHAKRAKAQTNAANARADREKARADRAHAQARRLAARLRDGQLRGTSRKPQRRAKSK